RDGRFLKDANNNLVTASGQRVLWQGTLPADAQKLHVNPDGSVMAQVKDTWTQVGHVQTYRFVNPSGLLNIGDSSFQVSNDSGAAQAGTPGATGYGRIMSGVVESSATKLSDEMSNMIVAQRAYSMSVKAFQQTDDMIGLAIHLRVR
ncbi:MAG: flagellar hook-basal body complex protein, partial [Chloroflexi bacterium]|nr:flagellar hook-basal body complex protein [Chloroflexota bacterium]